MKMHHHLKIATHLADLLDNKFKILGFKFGLDPLLGLIPWVGDFIGFVLSLYIVWIAREMKLPKDIISMMYRNVVTDLILGIVPVVGDISDFFFKANSKNLALLLKYKDTFQEGEILEARTVFSS